MKINNYIWENDLSLNDLVLKQKEEIERLHSIIKEAIEYIKLWHYRNDFRVDSFTKGVKEELLEILDKGSNKE